MDKIKWITMLIKHTYTFNMTSLLHVCYDAAQDHFLVFCMYVNLLQQSNIGWYALGLKIMVITRFYCMCSIFLDIILPHFFLNFLSDKIIGCQIRWNCNSCHTSLPKGTSPECKLCYGLISHYFHYFEFDKCSQVCCKTRLILNLGVA